MLYVCYMYEADDHGRHISGIMGTVVNYDSPKDENELDDIIGELTSYAENELAVVSASVTILNWKVML